MCEYLCNHDINGTQLHVTHYMEGSDITSIDIHYTPKNLNVILIILNRDHDDTCMNELN